MAMASKSSLPVPLLVGGETGVNDGTPGLSSTSSSFVCFSCTKTLGCPAVGAETARGRRTAPPVCWAASGAGSAGIIGGAPSVAVVVPGATGVVVVVVGVVVTVVAVGAVAVVVLGTPTERTEDDIVGVAVAGAAVGARDGQAGGISTTGGLIPAQWFVAEPSPFGEGINDGVYTGACATARGEVIMTCPPSWGRISPFLLVVLKEFDSRFLAAAELHLRS